MAAFRGGESFPHLEVSSIEELRNNAKNTNTKRSTIFWLGVFKSWAKERGFSEAIETYDAFDLDKILEKFYGEVRNKDGGEYEPDSLRVMIAALGRYLKDCGYQKSIIRDREFCKSKEVLEGKAKRLREEGKGKRPNKARSLTQEEEELLWTNGKLGNKTAESLINTMWWLLTQYFGLRGRQEHHGMKVEDFTIGKDNDGLEYVEYIEGPTKTRNGGLSKKSRDFLPKMYATGDERCPVALFNEYLSRRPAALQNSGPFYLSINLSNNNTWYKAQPMGTNRINEMMKRIVQGTQLEHQQQKKLTNHSVRKTVVNKLKSIVKVTGHRNLQSLDDYDEGDEQEQQQMSSRISWRNNPQQRRDGACTSSLAKVAMQQQQAFLADFQRQGQLNVSSSNQLSQATVTQESRQKMLNNNNFNNCQVTFSVGSTMTSPILPQHTSNPKRRRAYMIESDSD